MRAILVSCQDYSKINRKTMKSLLITIVVATLYNAVVEQTDSSPLVTASGAIINELCPESHRWVAVSRDLLRKEG